MLFFRFFLIVFFSLNALAQGAVPTANALSFAPPANDVSLVFLGNIFGVVDGVLAGTGSQIFPQMMAVFNSAVLALGSIIFTYVLVMGTMHTAHEGEFLGRQWSSILIPLRTTFGLALLVPKASGYCIVQIFVMWVVVQGVGAADKIWNSALDYLTQGGKIVQHQVSSTKATTHNDLKTKNPAYVGGIVMLSGQVCMLGLEKTLRQIQQSMRSLNMCSSDDTVVSQFCNMAIPNFLSTFDALKPKFTSEKDPYSVDMPNFETTSYFKELNGLCGTITWNGSQDSNKDLTRKVAVQTMYSFLSNVAFAMIGNDPLFANNYRGGTPVAPYAILEYGVPKRTNDSSQICTTVTAEACGSWATLGTGAGLFTGNEFLNGVLAYSATMMPILNSEAQAKQKDSWDKSKQFISDAKQNGWIFAGSYFFNLVNLSGSAAAPDSIIDLNSGLGDSKDLFTSDKGLVKKLGINNCPTYPEAQSICWFFKDYPNPVKNILDLIRSDGDGNPDKQLNINSGNLEGGKGYIVDGKGKCEGCLVSSHTSSSVYGFVGNSYMFQIKGQPSAGPISFTPILPSVIMPAPAVNFGVDFGCRGFMCIPGYVASLMSFVVNAVNLAIWYAFGPILNGIISLLIIEPLRVLVVPLLNQALAILGDVNNNPIVNLANMGAYFIQSAITFWINMVMLAVFTQFVSWGIAVLVLLAMFLPLLFAWEAYFIGIGFTTAFYVPMLPYMIFIFGAIGWLFAVIESMIAAPIVALIITTPEGEGVIGKGEQGLMILLNVFLRPSLMVIGFISGIVMSYVSVWVLNSTFGLGAQFLQIGTGSNSFAGSFTYFYNKASPEIAGLNWGTTPWAQLFGALFYVVIYISMYVTMVQKAFTLIYNIPDKIMRWVGGTQESYGQETADWVKGTEQQVEKFGEKTSQGLAKGIGNYPGEVQKLTGDGGGGGSDGSVKNDSGSDGGDDSGGSSGGPSSPADGTSPNQSDKGSPKKDSGKDQGGPGASGGEASGAEAAVLI